jgi:hypothetical protein
VFEKASLDGIAEVFDAQMCAAIRTDTFDGAETAQAAVTMTFPSQGLVDCVLSLAIHASEVEHLALRLFRVHVKVAGGIRHVFLREGVRLFPNPDVTLKGVPDEIVTELFGPEIHAAITASRMRNKELEEGNHATECVSMILPSDTREGAFINLSVGIKGGIQIRQKLYK